MGLGRDSALDPLLFAAPIGEALPVNSGGFLKHGEDRLQDI